MLDNKQVEVIGIIAGIIIQIFYRLRDNRSIIGELISSIKSNIKTIINKLLKF